MITKRECQFRATAARGLGLLKLSQADRADVDFWESEGLHDQARALFEAATRWQALADGSMVARWAWSE